MLGLHLSDLDAAGDRGLNAAAGHAARARRAHRASQTQCAWASGSRFEAVLEQGRRGRRHWASARRAGFSGRGVGDRSSRCLRSISPALGKLQAFVAKDKFVGGRGDCDHPSRRRAWQSWPIPGRAARASGVESAWPRWDSTGLEVRHPAATRRRTSPGSVRWSISFTWFRAVDRTGMARSDGSRALGVMRVPYELALGDAGRARAEPARLGAEVAESMDFREIVSRSSPEPVVVLVRRSPWRSARRAKGMQVAVHYSESRCRMPTIPRLARIAGAGGRTAEAFGADPSIRVRQGRSGWSTRVVTQRFGRLDVLVNSAAIMRKTPFGQVTVKEWDEILALNLRAPFFLAQAAAPHLARAPGGGVIVNIADLAAFEAWSAYLPHGVSKGGIVNITRGLAR